MPTNLDHQYLDASGNTWTYHPPPRDSFTRGPGDTGGNHAHWWVVDRYGPLTWAATAAEVASLTTERDQLRQRLNEAEDVIEAARAYERAWTVYASTDRTAISEVDAVLNKARAHQTLLDTTRAVDALGTPTSPSSGAQSVTQERVADHAADLTGVDPAASAVRAEP